MYEKMTEKKLLSFIKVEICKESILFIPSNLILSLHRVLSDGMFLRTVQEVATQYPDVQLEDMHIDRCCQKLVQNPYKFDVLLMPNLYGTVISNIACGLTGGTGLHSGSNFGENLAVFETATRHIAKDLAGQSFASVVPQAGF